MSRPADLNGVRRKLARARKKLDALREEVDAYVERRSCSFALEEHGRRQTIVCQVSDPPDEDWADEFAEIVYQARSALDILVQELAKANGSEPSRGRAFPIFQHQNEYLVRRPSSKQSKRDRLLDGVASRHRKVIDAAQPYHQGRQASRAPLAILSAISNTDKHNAVYVSVAALTNPGFRIVRPFMSPPDDDLTVNLRNELVPFPMADGQEMFSIEWTPDPGGSERSPVRLEPLDFEVTVGFRSGDHTFTLDDVDRALLKCSEVIDRCEARL